MDACISSKKIKIIYKCYIDKQAEFSKSFIYISYGFVISNEGNTSSLLSWTGNVT